MSLLVQSEVQGLLDLAFREKGRLRHGNNLQYHCPFCHHRKRKMEVCLDTNEWHCWVCDKKGRTIRSLFRLMKVGDGIQGKLTKVLPNESHRPNVVETDQLIAREPLTLPDEFRSLLCKSNTIAYRNARAYAKKRGITISDIIRHNIGYCDSGEYENRLIFPSYDANNQLNFFTGRSYFDDVYLKYKNPEADRNIIGFENLIDFRYPISLCEGALDAITGIKRNVIPLFGKTLSKKLEMALSSSLVKEIFIVLDDDAIQAAITMSEKLLSDGKIVHLVNLNGKDPNVLGFIETNTQMIDTPPLDFMKLMRLKLKL